MANVKFDDYLNDELKNNDFKSGYLNEKPFWKALSLLQVPGCLKDNLLKYLMFQNLQLQELNVDIKYYFFSFKTKCKYPSKPLKHRV